MSVAMVQLVEPRHLGIYPNVSTNEYLDDYGIIQDVKTKKMKSV
jgi:hypothetical protein